MKPQIKSINKSHARKLLKIVDAGLVMGIGKAKPGEMCVMAAINFAFNMPHDDTDYGCTHEVVRTLDIAINDLPWSSPAARARGMRREAIAKLGSKDIDGVKFIRLVALGVVNRILPPMLRAINLADHATACESATTLHAASSAARSASSATSSAARSASSAASYAASDAADYAAGSARDAARSASYAARSASSAASSAASYAGDAVFTTLCDISTDALIACGSKGSKWLDLCEDNIRLDDDLRKRIQAEADKNRRSRSNQIVCPIELALETLKKEGTENV